MAEEIGVGGLFKRRLERHSVVGHRGVLPGTDRINQLNPSRRTTVATSPGRPRGPRFAIAKLREARATPYEFTPRDETQAFEQSAPKKDTGKALRTDCHLCTCAGYYLRLIHN
jgi:hypothetical protein